MLKCGYASFQKTLFLCFSFLKRKFSTYFHYFFCTAYVVRIAAKQNIVQAFFEVQTLSHQTENNLIFFCTCRARVVSRISFFFLGGGQFFSQKKFFFRREKMVFQGFLGVFRAFSTKPRSHRENPIPQSFRISWWYVASVRV